MIDMERYKEKVEEAVVFLQKRIATPPELVIVLGTGLGGLATAIKQDGVIPYVDIPHFPRPTVTSHIGNLICGRLGGKNVAALQGRFHFYEGYSTRELTFPIRVLSLLGPEIFIVTNAAGGLNPSYTPGTIMVLRDHLNLLGENPLRGPNIDQWGPRFPDFSTPYDQELIATALSCAQRLKIPDVVAGVYAAIPGPSLETAAETRFLRNSGADGVGMSTVPEVIVARHAGLRVLGLSLIANVNDPDRFAPILIDDVINRVREAEPRLQQLILEVIRKT